MARLGYTCVLTYEQHGELHLGKHVAREEQLWQNMYRQDNEDKFDSFSCYRQYLPD